MKKISIAILTLLVTIAACKKVPEVNKEYVDVERDLITVGTTTATIQCDYEYIATLKKAFLYYCEGADTTNISVAEMSVVQKTLYVELSGLKENTTFSYYYEFANGFNSMRSATKTFKTEALPVTPPEITLPTVVTAEVTEITSNSAQCGGEVTNDGGAEVTERGICWSTSANPNLNDSHIASGAGTGAFTAMMNGLEANTAYHVRAYATNEKGTAYGLDREFTTLLHHDYVDLGLPSGLLWATCNVGASEPEDYGDYFAWGETQIKDVYIWNNYQYYNGIGSYGYGYLTKYSPVSTWGYNGFTDNLTTLLQEDDAASVNWGNDWRMPTYDEWMELFLNTNQIWTTQNGINGKLITGPNGNSLFLPATGFNDNDEPISVGIIGCYWSSSLHIDFPQQAWFKSISSSSGNGMSIGHFRENGQSVRPVRSANYNKTGSSRKSHEE